MYIHVQDFRDSLVPFASPECLNFEQIFLCKVLRRLSEDSGIKDVWLGLPSILTRCILAGKDIDPELFHLETARLSHGGNLGTSAMAFLEAFKSSPHLCKKIPEGLSRVLLEMPERKGACLYSSGFSRVYVPMVMPDRQTVLMDLIDESPCQSGKLEQFAPVLSSRNIFPVDGNSADLSKMIKEFLVGESPRRRPLKIVATGEINDEEILAVDKHSFALKLNTAVSFGADLIFVPKANLDDSGVQRRQVFGVSRLAEVRDVIHTYAIRSSDFVIKMMTLALKGVEIDDCYAHLFKKLLFDMFLDGKLAELVSRVIYRHFSEGKCDWRGLILICEVFGRELEQRILMCENFDSFSLKFRQLLPRGFCQCSRIELPVENSYDDFVDMHFQQENSDSAFYDRFLSSNNYWRKLLTYKAEKNVDVSFPGELKSRLSQLELYQLSGDQGSLEDCAVRDLLVFRPAMVIIERVFCERKFQGNLSDYVEYLLGSFESDFSLKLFIQCVVHQAFFLKGRMEKNISRATKSDLASLKGEFWLAGLAGLLRAGHSTVKILIDKCCRFDDLFQLVDTSAGILWIALLRLNGMDDIPGNIAFGNLKQHFESLIVSGLEKTFWGWFSDFMTGKYKIEKRNGSRQEKLMHEIEKSVIDRCSWTGEIDYCQLLLGLLVLRAKPTINIQNRLEIFLSQNTVVSLAGYAYVAYILDIISLRTAMERLAKQFDYDNLFAILWPELLIKREDCHRLPMGKIIGIPYWLYAGRLCTFSKKFVV